MEEEEDDYFEDDYIEDEYVNENDLYVANYVENFFDSEERDEDEFESDVAKDEFKSDVAEDESDVNFSTSYDEDSDCSSGYDESS